MTIQKHWKQDFVYELISTGIFDLLNRYLKHWLEANEFVESTEVHSTNSPFKVESLQNTVLKLTLLNSARDALNLLLGN